MRDDLMNVISGLGTGRDKNSYNSFAVRNITPSEVNAAYRSSGLTRKVHDIYPLEMTRAGRDWDAEGDELDALYDEEVRLKIWPKLRSLLQKARLYGGGALLLGINRGAPSDPITPDMMRPGDLQFVHVLAPDQLMVERIVRDPANPFYGEPEYYRLTDGNSTLVDPSRVIPLIGQALPDPMQEGRFWGDPLLTSLWGSLTNSDLVHQTVAALLPEIKADTISIPNLGQLLLSCEGESQVQKRIAAASLMQSMFNVRLLDGGDGTDRNPGDKWETRQLNVTGFPALMEAFIARVAAETDIPVTRLAGTSPGGLNQSGNNEQRDFEKAISARQETELRPVLERLDPFLVANVGQSEVPYFSFSPLSQLSESERWDNEKKRAETFQIYVNSGMFGDDLAASTRLAMAESDMWPGLEAEATEEVFDPAETAAMTDAAPRTLYVSRAVLPETVAALKAWASEQGLPELQDDLHVTVAFSRQPVDWMEMGHSWESLSDDGKLTVQPGGARIVEPLGDRTAVLLFASSDLSWRNRDMRERGASWDYSDYTPHISLTGEPVSLEGVTPYVGAILLGPEIFSEIEE